MEQSMTLSEYLRRKDLTHDQFAELLGCTRAAVTRWASGSRTPSPKWIKLIERKTARKVRAEDFKRVGLNITPGYRLFMAITRKGLTIREAATKMKISRNALARYIKLNVQPSSEHTDKIKRRFGVSI